MTEAKERQKSVLLKENEEKISGWIARYSSILKKNLSALEKKMEIQLDEHFLQEYFSLNRYDEYSMRLNSAILYLGAQKAFDNVPAISNEYEYIDIIKKGVPKKSIYYLMAVTDFTSNDMASLLQISLRELKRNHSNDLLTIEQSEKAVEIARLYSRGAEVFGDLDAFKEWIESTVMALGNKKPKDFLDTSLGIEMLMDELGRIEHGIFA